jgi:putative ABC transport system permease protein
MGAAPFVSSAPHDLTVDDGIDVQRRVREVRVVAPISLGTATAEAEGRSREVTVIGTTETMKDVRKLRVGAGRYLPAGVRDAPICVLGAKVARELFGNGNPLGRTIRAGEFRFRVIGVMVPRGTSIGLDLDEVVHVPVETAMRLFDRSSLFRLLAEVRSPEEIPAAEREVIRVLTERHDGDEDVTVVTQDSVLTTFNRLFAALTLALAGIAAISLTVAGIGIMNVMLVSVSERTGEIGLLKAVGVTRRQVLAVFLAEAAMVSGAGGVLGLLAGVAGGRLVMHFQPDFPVHAPPWAVAAALAVSLAVGLAFGGLPARRAAGLDPVAALSRRGR